MWQPKISIAFLYLWRPPRLGIYTSLCRSTDHLSSITFKYNASSTVRTTCSCCSDSDTLAWQVFSLSRSCAGGCIMSRYLTDVCSEFMVLACWLNEVQEDIGLLEDLMADGHSSNKWVNQSAVLSSVNVHSSIILCVTGSMSFVTSGMHNHRLVDTLIPFNKFDLGEPIYHDVTCGACVWIKNAGKFVCKPTSYPVIHVHITMHVYIP